MQKPLSRLAFVLALALVALLGLLSSRAAAAPLLTGFLDEQALFDGPDRGVMLGRVKSAGASAARYMVYWRDVAPTRPTIATDPNDLAYDWSKVDRMVLTAHARGVQPILDLVLAPDWAQGSVGDARYGGPYRPGSVRPNAADFGAFAQAAAKRYSGTFIRQGTGTPLPRVKYWQAWNETNYVWFLVPQYDSNGHMDSADIYRNMVNAFTAGVHAVHPDNVAIAGGTAPWGHKEQPAPLKFARAVMCLSQSTPYRSVCNDKVHFDAWSTHPYTKGGPTHKADNAGDLELGDLPALRSVLAAADNLGKVVTAKPRPELWVTEFSWDTDLPDPKAVPQSLHTRWTSEALYRMWLSRVHMAVWFTVRDRPLPKSFWQSGFWYCGAKSIRDDPSNVLCTLGPSRDVRKPSLQAFRFPFVAYARKGKVSVWGRLPPGTSRTVAIERSRKHSSGYKRVAKIHVRSDRIFQLRQRTAWTRGFYRAHILSTGERSVPFSLTRPKDYALARPFGCGGTVRCK